MDFKTRFLLAKKNGQVERFRGDEISRRIAKEYPLNAQIALEMNLMKDLLSGTKDHYTEWEVYEVFRESVKNEVDAEIQAIGV